MRTLIYDTLTGTRPRGGETVQTRGKSRQVGIINCIMMESSKVSGSGEGDIEEAGESAREFEAKEEVYLC